MLEVQILMHGWVQTAIRFRQNFGSFWLKADVESTRCFTFWTIHYPLKCTNCLRTSFKINFEDSEMYSQIFKTLNHSHVDHKDPWTEVRTQQFKIGLGTRRDVVL